MAIILHVGLPRTATTVLQTHVFPRLRQFIYLGKESDNRLVTKNFHLFQTTQDAIRDHLAGDPGALTRMRRPLMTVLHFARVANRNKSGSAAQVCELWAKSMSLVEDAAAGVPLLYSDEAFVESASGLTATLDIGDGVTIEQLARVDSLQNAGVCIVLRDPAEFLRASYYKTMEHRFKRGRPGLSFEEYLRVQIALFERAPSASRLFLCMHGTFTNHLKALFSRVNVVRYRELIDSPHALDTLLGYATGEEPIALTDLPRENATWRNPDVTAAILGAPGVPRGIDIEQYSKTFPETMDRLALTGLEFR